MRTKTENLLLEAFRRWVSFEKGKDPRVAWTGLGTKAEYRDVVKEGYMEWVHLPPRTRMMGWLRLTDKGMTAMQEILEKKYYT